MAEIDPSKLNTDTRARVLPKGRSLAPRTLNDGAVEMVPVTSGRVKAHPKNPRRGNLAAIRESVARNGFYGAVVANRRTGHIVAGNHRFIAAQDLGFAEVPVQWIDVGSAEERRILAADNRTSDLGDYDNEALASLLEGLAGEEDGEGLAGTGYGAEDLEALLEGLGDGLLSGATEEALEEDAEALEERVNAADELARKWGTTRGQIWQVGAHRLMCGDSTSESDLDALLSGAVVDLLLTDPPYGVSYADKNAFLNSIGIGNRVQERILNDHMKPEQMCELWLCVFSACAKRMKSGAVYYMTGPQGGNLSMMMMMIQKSGLLLKHVLVWLKNQMVFGRCDYHYKHEPILYGWKEGGAHFFGGESNETSVWECKRPNSSKFHPTMKPVELFERAVKNGSRPRENVLDPFMGSGTTALACEAQGRVAFGMELSPSYLAVQLERLAELGLKPKLVQP